MANHRRLSILGRLLASLGPVSLQDPAPTLEPPRIPIAEFNGGIRWKDISDPDVPVLAVIAAYPQIQFNDSIQLFWNNQWIDTAVVGDAELDRGSITIEIPTSAIQDGTSPVHYLVTSPNGQNQYLSHPLNIRVKTNIPGGPDSDPDTPYTNERLLAVTGVPVLVDENNADNIIATVSPYLNMTEDDIVKLSWGGAFVSHPVHADEVGESLSLRISRDAIEQAGAGPVGVEYEVRDVVNNWSLWSIKFIADVEIGNDLLPAPRALDVIDNKLDLTTLGDKNAEVQTPSYPGMASNDEVELYWEARLPSGNPLEEQWTERVEDPGWPVRFFVPNSLAVGSAGGTVSIKYIVTSSRGVQYSKRSTFEVIGQAQNLPLPIVKEALDGLLDPQSIPESGACVAVPAYPGMALGDRVELFLCGKDVNGIISSDYYVAPIENEDVEEIGFLVARMFFLPLVYGSVVLYYRVNDRDSDRLELTVVGQEGAELPPLSVRGTHENVLDPDTVLNGTEAIVPHYGNKAIDDQITLCWLGLPEASYSDQKVVDSTNLEQPIDFHIAYDPYIISNINTSVAVSYSVRRADGSSATSAPLTIQVRSMSDETLVPPTVLEAPTGTLDPSDAQEGATVRVAFEGMLTSDVLAVCWMGEDMQDSWNSEPVPGDPIGHVDFIVPAGIVLASQGKTISVQYGVRRNDTPRLSKPLELIVASLQAGEDDFSGFTPQDLIVGVPLRSPTGLVITPYIVNEKEYIRASIYSDSRTNVLLLTDYSEVEFTVGRKFSTCSLTYSRLETEGHQIEFHDESGLIEACTLPQAPGTPRLRYDYTAPPGKAIKSIMLKCKDEPDRDAGIFINTITWQ